MKVLDFGSGGGDTSCLLASIVGPQGHVTGIDLSPEAIDASNFLASSQNLTNVTFVRRDVMTDDLEPKFDVVFGRFVLMYCPNPAETLARLRRFVRPGGLIVFIEPDYSGGRMSVPLPFCQKVAGLVRSAMKGSGADISMGLNLYSAFVQAGLRSPQMRLEAVVGGGEEFPGYALVVGFALLLRSQMQHLGLDVDDINPATLETKMREELAASQGAVVLANIVCAWSRVP